LDEKDISARGFEGNKFGGVTYTEPRLTVEDYEKYKADLGNIEDDKKLNAVLDDLGIVLDGPVAGVEYKYTEAKNGQPSKLQIGDNITIYSNGKIETKIRQEGYNEYTPEDVFKDVKKDPNYFNAVAYEYVQSHDSDFTEYLKQCGINNGAIGGDFSVGTDKDGNVTYVDYNNYRIYNDGKGTIVDIKNGSNNYDVEEINPTMIKSLLNDQVAGNEQLGRITGITKTDLYGRIDEDKRNGLTMPIYEISLDNGSRYSYNDTITSYITGFNNEQRRNLGYLVNEDGELYTGYEKDPNVKESGIQGIYASGKNAFIVFTQQGGPWEYTPIKEKSHNIRGAGCGLTSTSTILYGNGVDILPEDFENMRSADDGVQEGHMDRYGFEHKYVNSLDEAIYELEQGHQVLYHLHGTKAGEYYSGHYVPLLGIDEDKNIFVGDPWDPDNVGFHSKDEFEGFYTAIAVWQDTGERWVGPDEARDRYFRYENVEDEDIESPAKDQYKEWKQENEDKLRNSRNFDDEQYEQFMKEQEERTGLTGDSDD